MKRKSRKRRKTSLSHKGKMRKMMMIVSMRIEKRSLGKIIRIQAMSISGSIRGSSGTR
jgi:hypothetical protein